MKPFVFLDETGPRDEFWFVLLLESPDELRILAIGNDRDQAEASATKQGFSGFKSFNFFAPGSGEHLEAWLVSSGLTEENAVAMIREIGMTVAKAVTA